MFRAEVPGNRIGVSNYREVLQMSYPTDQRMEAKTSAPPRFEKASVTSEMTAHAPKGGIVMVDDVSAQDSPTNDLWCVNCEPAPIP
jgi:hypothetical protein